MRKLISVIVRTRNRPDFLKQALESLHSQTYPWLEVIVVNDAGQDVLDIVAPYASSFFSLKYLLHERRKGRAAAANTGLKAVSGDFIAFLDDDDLIFPEHYSFLIEHISKIPCILYTRARYEIYDPSGKLLYNFSPWEGPFLRKNLLLGNFIPLHTLLFPRNVVERIGFFDEDFELFEDWDFLIRASREFPFKGLNKITAIYRFFSKEGIAQISHGSSKEREMYFKILEKHKEDFNQNLFYYAYLRKGALRYELSLLQEKEIETRYKLKQTVEQLAEAKQLLNEAINLRDMYRSKIKYYQNKLDLYQNRIEELNRSLELLRQENRDLQTQIQIMQSTLGWQLLQAVRKLLNSIAPPHTKRGKGLALFRLILKLSLNKYGRKQLRENFRKFWRYLRFFGFKAALNKALIHGELLCLPPTETPKYGKVLEAILNREPSPYPSLSKPVTVVIPVFNAFEKVRNCLESVLKNTDLSKVHLVVIDDASTDKRIYPYLSSMAIKYRFELRKHHKNLGFVATVNEAIETRRGHLVILNSDTEVPPFWLERLLAPILIDPERIASTTPFSNCATICSFPEFCKDNPLPLGLSTPEIDEIFRLLWGKIQPIEIPTGVGFCMALNDFALQKVGNFDEKTFGKGYGEENDWCLRASKKGFKHLHIPWLFVSHYHGASFGEEKKRLSEKGIQLMEKKHPGYLRQIHTFIAHDPAREIRETLKLLLFFRHSPSPRLLALSHNLGGGCRLFLKDLKKILHRDSFVSLIFSGRNYLLYYKEINFTLSPRPQHLERLSKILKPDILFVNHLIGTGGNLENILEILENLSCPKIYFLHDYYSLCPAYTLINDEGAFCGLPKDTRRCRECLKKDLASRGIMADIPTIQDISSWRKMWKRFLERTKVIAPSQSAAMIFQKVYPEIQVEVIPHYVYPLQRYSPPQRKPTQPLVVAMLGALNFYKGADIVYRLAERIERYNLPLKLVLFGYTHKDNRYYSEKFIITGPYRREELVKLCTQHQPEVALIPSICPETYSYTLSEALSLGLPALVFDIGAQADLVKDSGAGIVIPYADEEKLVKILLALQKDRTRLRDLQRRAASWRKTSYNVWADLWQQTLRALVNPI